MQALLLAPKLLLLPPLLLLQPGLTSQMATLGLTQMTQRLTTLGLTQQGPKGLSGPKGPPYSFIFPQFGVHLFQFGDVLPPHPKSGCPWGPEP